MNVFQPCAIIVEKEEDIAAFKDYKDDGSGSTAKKQPSEGQASSSTKSEKKDKESTSKTEQQAASTPKKEKTPSTPDKTTKGERIAVSPLAKKLAEEKGISIEVND